MKQKKKTTQVPVDPISPAIAARLLEVSVPRVYALVKQGQLTAYHNGKSPVFSLAEVEALQEQRELDSLPPELVVLKKQAEQLEGLGNAMSVEAAELAREKADRERAEERRRQELHEALLGKIEDEKEKPKPSDVGGKLMDLLPVAITAGGALYLWADKKGWLKPRP